MKDNELQLIALVKQGDAAAFAKLYETYYHLVFYYAWNLSRNEADARDITQETFLQVYKSIDTLRNDALFIAWLRKITLSKSQLLFRKNKDKICEIEEICKKAGNEKRSEFIPHQYLNNLNDREILEGLLFRLPKKRRDVMELFYFEQKSIEEISQILNISIGTVKSRLHHARIALKEEVEEFERIEGRKLTFQVDTLFVGVSFGFLSYFTYLKHTKHIQKLYSIAQVGVLSVCTVTGVIAVNETYQMVQNKKDIQEDAVVQTVQKETAFTPIVYRNQTISSTNDAYFILMQFAGDKELLEEKNKEELVEIQPVVEELCKSDNAYKQRLEQDGWIEKFHFLTNI